MKERTPITSIGRHIIIGALTAAPLAITWFIIDFLFGQLSRIGRPWVGTIARAVSSENPQLAAWLQNETFLSILAATVILIGLWALGWMTTRVIGRRLIRTFEALISLIPFVDKIYRATKRFLMVAGSASESERRVVLIAFPSEAMKTIGLVTRMLKDETTGEELAVIYVPTSPNPTSGYIEIVPVRDVIFTDWTFDQAMSFVITGGSNAPDILPYFSGRGQPPAPP